GLRKQAIAFTSTPPVSPSIGDSYTPAATATSGLTVAFTIDAASSDGACTLTGGVVKFAALGGVCTVDANQPGDSTWSAAPQAQQTIALQTTVPTLSWGNPFRVGSTNLNGVSCPSTTFCVAAGGNGSFTSGDPDPGTWNTSSDGLSSQVDSISCPST